MAGSCSREPPEFACCAPMRAASARTMFTVAMLARWLCLRACIADFRWRFRLAEGAASSGSVGPHYSARPIDASPHGGA